VIEMGKQHEEEVKMPENIVNEAGLANELNIAGVVLGTERK
jgi:hypothetical protein